MCIVADLNKLNDEIKERRVLAPKELDVIHGKLQDLIHFVEFEKYSASEGAKILKQIKILRQKRRELKREIELMDKVFLNIDKSVQSANRDCHYYYRSDVVKETVGREDLRI